MSCKLLLVTSGMLNSGVCMLVVMVRELEFASVLTHGVYKFSSDRAALLSLFSGKRAAFS